MKTRIIATIGLILIAIQLAQPQAIDAMRRSTSVLSSDLTRSQTNSLGAAGQKFETSITWSNVLESMKLFSNWTGGSASTSPSFDSESSGSAGFDSQ